jgi:hypothetical protein
MENLIEDILNQLINDALELKHNSTSDFIKAELIGYYKCISKILNQAEAFGMSHLIPENLRDFNAESLITDF